MQKLSNNLPFLPERMKIRKCGKLLLSLYDKNEYVVHMRIKKILQKLHRAIKSNKKAWLNPYIKINTK